MDGLCTFSVNIIFPCRMIPMVKWYSILLRQLFDIYPLNQPESDVINQTSFNPTWKSSSSRIRHVNSQSNTSYLIFVQHWTRRNSMLNSCLYTKKLKADRPHPHNYLPTHTDYRHSDNHLRLIMVVVALFCTDGRTDATKYIISPLRGR